MTISQALLPPLLPAVGYPHDHDAVHSPDAAPTAADLGVQCHVPPAGPGGERVVTTRRILFATFCTLINQAPACITPRRSLILRGISERLLLVVARRGCYALDSWLDPLTMMLGANSHSFADVSHPLIRGLFERFSSAHSLIRSFAFWFTTCAWFSGENCHEDHHMFPARCAHPPPFRWELA